MRPRILPILFLSLLIGCKSATEDEKTAGDANVDNGKAKAGGLKLLVIRNFPGVSNTKIDESIGPSNEELREAFNSLDWAATGQSNGMSLTQAEPHIITLGLKQHSKHGLLMQFSERPPGQSKWSHLYANSMTTEEALNAFLSFNNKNDDFRTMIDWKSESEFEAE